MARKLEGNVAPAPRLERALRGGGARAMSHMPFAVGLDRRGEVQAP